MAMRSNLGYIRRSRPANIPHVRRDHPAGVCKAFGLGNEGQRLTRCARVLSVPPYHPHHHALHTQIFFGINIGVFGIFGF